MKYFTVTVDVWGDDNWTEKNALEYIDDLVSEGTHIASAIEATDIDKD